MLEARVHLKRRTEFHTTGPVQMVSMRYTFGNEIPHDHEFHELVLVRGGVGTHITDAGSYQIVRGYVFVICPGQTHNYGGLENLDIVNFLYLPEELGDGLAQLPGSHGLFENRPDLPFIILDEANMSKVEELVMEVQLEQERRNPGWEYFVRMAFLRLVGIVCRATLPQPEQPLGESRMLRLLRFLDRNHAQELRLSELARLCGISESTLVRSFRALTGDSLTDYLIKLRLEKGATLLRESESTVLEIALSVGFQSSSYFSRMFRRKFKLSPRDYRNQFRRGSALGGKALNRETVA